MRSDPSVVTLVARAAQYDQQAWDELVERYIPLVWSICVRYQLSSHDIEDVSQSVWLGLVSHLNQLRDPAALPGWLATTTRRECVRVRRAARDPRAAACGLELAAAAWCSAAEDRRRRRRCSASTSSRSPISPTR